MNGGRGLDGCGGGEVSWEREEKDDGSGEVELWNFQVMVAPAYTFVISQFSTQKTK